MVGRVSCILFYSVVFAFTRFGTYEASAADEDSTPTPNWTIGADGKGRWTYGQYVQLGSNGFFGPYDVDRSAGGNFAPLNGWMGVQNYQNLAATNILAAGTNSSSSVLGLELNPTTTFGWASVTGRYKFTPYGTGTAPGGEVPISPGQWTQWNIGVTMPIGGTVFVGKKYFQRGCGLQFGWNRTQEYILFESYGTPMPDFLTGWLPGLVKQPKTDPIRPLTLKICRKPIPCSAEAIDTPETDPVDDSKYLPFSGSEAEISECIASGRCTETEVDSDCLEGTFPLRWKDPVTGVVAPYEKCSGRTVYEGAWNDWATLKFGFGFLPWQQDTLITSLSPNATISPGPVLAIPPTFWNNYDVNVAQQVSLIAYLMWYNDVINFEVGTLYSASHVGPELARTTLSRNAFAPTNFSTSEGWVYLRYLNGRYALRAELDWFTKQIRYQRSSDGTFFGAPNNTDGSGSLFAP